ncbi:hypothetical protein CCH79_00014210, partial [Gambusia affinis]
MLQTSLDPQESLLVLMERSGNAQRFWTQCAAAMESLIAMSVSSARRYLKPKGTSGSPKRDPA